MDSRVATFLLVICVASPAFPSRQQKPKAEDAWLQLRDEIASKLADCQRRDEAPTYEALRSELEKIDDLARRYRLSDPEVAVAALFFKASLLDDRLGDEERALAAYDTIISWKGLDVFFVANALVSKASIFRKQGRIKDLEAMIVAYAKRTDADTQVLDYLRATLRKARLKIGTPFPDFRLPLLTGGEVDRKGLAGRVAVILFFLSTKKESLEQLQALERLARRDPDPRHAGDRPRIIAVALDVDRERLAKLLAGHQIGLPVAFEGKGWETSLAVRCGIQSVPSSFVLGRDGRILAVDVLGPSLLTVVKEALEKPSSSDAGNGDEGGGGRAGRG